MSVESRFKGRPCPDCGVPKGEKHRSGCDVARCSLCGDQAISCDCCWQADGETREEFDRRFAAFEAKHRELAKPWDEDWPGDAECREYGFYCRMEGGGWKVCGPDDEGAVCNTTRLAHECEWSVERQRFVKAPK